MAVSGTPEAAFLAVKIEIQGGLHRSHGLKAGGAPN